MTFLSLHEGHTKIISLLSSQEALNQTEFKQQLQNQVHIRVDLQLTQYKKMQC